ncbi:hypothetical protein STZ1_30428 [Bacillus subtilis]
MDLTFFDYKYTANLSAFKTICSEQSDYLTNFDQLIFKKGRFV